MSVSALDVLVLALATWRLSSWLVDPLDGGFTVFARLRYLAGIRYDEHSNAYCKKHEWLGKWFMCLWCMSAAIGAVFTLLYVAMGQLLISLLLPLALSTLAIVMDSYILRLTRRVRG